tara:strand:- start:4280 stop:4609 length:330 start_codon:yes stop_codon:yes gene_type:complete
MYALNYVVFPKKNRPFYAGGCVIDDFINTYCEQVNKQPDVLFVVKEYMESLDEIEYETYVHSGIYLGGEKDICFEQHERGGEFRLSSLEDSVKKHSFDLSGLEFFRIKT